jgi:hypothetical protein
MPMLKNNEQDGGFLLIAPDEVVVATQAYSVDAFLRTMLNRGVFHGTIRSDPVESVATWVPAC